MKIVDYKIVNADNAYDLEEVVIFEIKEGWQPFGGVAIKHHFSQAMVKYEEELKEGHEDGPKTLKVSYIPDLPMPQLGGRRKQSYTNTSTT